MDEKNGHAVVNPLVFLGQVLVGSCKGHHIGLTEKGRLILFDHTIEEALAEAGLDALTAFHQAPTDCGSSTDAPVMNIPAPLCVCGAFLTDHYGSFRRPPQWTKNGTLTRNLTYHIGQRMASRARRDLIRSQITDSIYQTSSGLHGMSRAIAYALNHKHIRQVALSKWELLRSST